MTVQDDMVEKLIRAVEMKGAAPHFHDAKVRQLAMQWPSLAAAIGELMEGNGHRPPGPFRHAMHNMAQEKGSRGGGQSGH